MMSCDILKKRKSAAHRIFCGFLAFTFFFSWILPPGYAQLIPQNVLNLPAPGTMVTPSAAFVPVLINGITVHPENPLEFDFIVGTGDDKMQGKAFEEESTKLIKYFLASLTVPEDEMWVNLSPYEKDRIIPTGFGTTEMGRDLLAQDYILKQLTASLMYPEKELGKKFWDKIYRKAREQYGTAEIPVNTFNKVWIVPEKAVVYEHGNSAFVVKARLKVMLGEDYKAMGHNVTRSQSHNDVAGDVVTATEGSPRQGSDLVTSQIIREVILPAIEQEVNEGKSFANLRQIYHSAILAAWFKQNLKETLLGQVYVDKARTKGIDVEDKTVNEKIYAQYLEAFKKGVYNYIKEDIDPATREMIPRKYFSGGTNLKVGDLVETYKKGMSLTRPQQEIVGEYLAALKEYNQGMVRANLVELSKDMSVADAQKAVASSRQAARKSSSPVDYEYWAQRLKLGPSDLIHMKGLLRKFASLQTQLVIGRNFLPSALLTEKERQKFLGATEYIRISGDASNAEKAKEVVVTFNPMDGGLGTSVKRQAYLERIMGRTQIGAKGTDLFLNYKTPGMEKSELVSIAEIKLLRVIKDSFHFGSVIFQPLVNRESAPSYDDLLKSDYLLDKVNAFISSKRTYRQVMEQTGVRLLPAEDQMLYQMDLPVIDIESGELTDRFTAPGGHGQWGVRLLLDALKFEIPADGKTHIRAFYNGDGIANIPDASIIGWMAKNDVPIVMISTTKVGLDKKGGQLGIQRLDDGTVRPQILEVAQAKKAGKGHENLFYSIGLSGLGKIDGIDENGNPKKYTNEANQQYFNTNIAILNYNVLTPILQALVRLDNVEFETELLSGQELVERIISPDLIENVKKKNDGRRYTQLEGAIASTLLNLDAFFMTTKDQRVKDILGKKGIKKILHVVNVDNLRRTDFFTPVKNAFDFWFQSHSDSYALDRERWTLREARDGLDLPTVDVVAYKRDAENRLILDEKGNPQDDEFYADVQNVIDSFGTASTKGLVSLDIKGRVAFKDAVLKGAVRIISEYRNPATNHVFDLKSLEARTALGQEGYQPLVLENIKITIAQDGSLFWEPIASSPVSSGDENIGSSVDEIEDDMRSSSPVVEGVPAAELAQKIVFGTSGWRAAMDGRNFTLHNVGRLAKAVASVLPTQRVPLPGSTFRVGVTYGGRKLSKEAAQRAVEVLTAYGIQAFMGSDITTTPAAMALTRKELGQDALDLVVHFDASHNEVTDNGMKVFEKGVVAPDALTALFALKANDETSSGSYERVALGEEDIAKMNAAEQTLARYRNTFGELKAKVQAYQRQRPGMEMTVDVLHGASGNFVGLLQEMGARVIRREPLKEEKYPPTVTIEGQSRPYRPEPVRPIVELTQEFRNFEQTAADGSVYLAIDGDADRLAAWVKKDGKIVEMLPNDLGILFGWYLISTGKAAGATKIVKTLPTTAGMNALARRAGLEIVETPVGSKHFAPYLEEMVIGVEESGHIVMRIGNDIWFDDAVAEAMLLLEIMAERGANPVTVLEEVREDIGFSGVYARDNVMLTDSIKENIQKPLRENPRELAERIQQAVGERATGIFVTTKQGTVVPLDSLADGALNVNEGIHLKFSDGSWVQPRLSGTEPVMRIYTEAPSAERRQHIRDAVVSALRIASSPIENIPRAVEALAGRDLNGVRVLIRANLNVTMTGDGDIPDTTRLKELDPIIKFLLARKADIILLGHNGRLEDGKDSRRSLRRLLEYFQLRFINVPVTFYERSITGEGLKLEPGKLIINKYDKGSVHILQNVRFADKFENGKPGSPQRDAFGRGLAGLTKGDNGKTGILVVDAFGDIGSKGASVEDLPRHFTAMGGEVYAGPSMVKEFENFGQVLKQGIDVIIFGGVKSDKIEPLVRIVNHSLSPDGQIFLGSAPSAALAMGHPLLKNLMADNPGRVLTAVDYSNPQNTFDIGLQTRQLFLQKLDALRAGQTVLLNGTMGYVEEPSGQYKEGTKVIIEKLKELAGRGVRIIILGGDGGANAREYGLNKIENVSLITGGGVPLKILAGEELVGIKALQNAVSPVPSEEEFLLPIDDEAEEPAQEFMPMAFLAPGRKVAVVLEGYWKAGGRSRISLQEISARTGLNKEFVLAAINGINGNFNSPFAVEAAGLHKKLDNETLWIQLVARRPMGEFRSLSQGLQPDVSSSPIEGLEVALIGGREDDVADNLRLIGQLLAVNESSKVLVGGATALAILEAKKMIDPGASGVDQGVVEDARSYMNHYRVISPSQVEVMDPNDPASREVVRVGTGERVPRGKVIVGFGEQTIRTYADIISGSKSAFWNGPMDVDGTPQKIIEALAQAQRRGPLFVGEGSVDEAQAADLTGFVPFSRDDFSKFLDDKAMKGGRGVTVSQQVKDRVPPEEVGGINLNPALLDLQIKRDGNGVPLPLPMQPIESMHIEGFIPVIINITPVTNLPLLLGLADTRQGEDETRPAIKAREPEEISALN